MLQERAGEAEPIEKTKNSTRTARKRLRDCYRRGKEVGVLKREIGWEKDWEACVGLGARSSMILYVMERKPGDGLWNDEQEGKVLDGEWT